MHIKHITIFIFLHIFSLECAIILWSNKKVEISPLLPFDDEDLEKLVEKLEVKKVFLFKVTLPSRNSIVPQNLKEAIGSFYSSYNPNGNVGTANATGKCDTFTKLVLSQLLLELALLEGCNGIDINKISKVTGPLYNNSNFLCVLDITYSRKKRSADDTTLTSKVDGKGDVDVKGN